MLTEMLNAFVIIGLLTIVGLSIYLIISGIKNRRLNEYYAENPGSDPLNSVFNQ
jgi:hypothetical protein